MALLSGFFFVALCIDSLLFRSHFLLSEFILSGHMVHTLQFFGLMCRQRVLSEDFKTSAQSRTWKVGFSGQGLLHYLWWLYHVWTITVVENALSGILRLGWHWPKVIYHVYKSSSLVPILHQMNTVQPAYPASLRSNLILSSKLRPVLPGALFLWLYYQNSTCCSAYSTYAH